MLRHYSGGRSSRGHHQLGYEQRIAEIWQRVLKSLRGVNRAQVSEIRFLIFTDEHEAAIQAVTCPDTVERPEGWLSSVTLRVAFQ